MAPDPAAVRQDAAASGHAQQAVLGAGTLNAYFGDHAREAEPPVSIAAPFGRRDESLPLRGRNALLAKLAADAGRVRVLHGLGGCGKTRLALEVAYRAQQRGYEVWWVSAADSTALVTGMRAVGRRLGLTDAELEHGDAADVIWRRLAERREPWLLVIDNMDDPGILAGAGTHLRDGRGWLRPVSARSGSVLLTSRDGSAANWASWCRRTRLAVLPDYQAAEVLADHAGRRTDLGSDDDARSLAERLGGLPLALTIAGSYLAEAASTPEAFTDPGLIRTYRQYQDALEGKEPAQGQVRDVIGRIRELSLDLLDARQLPEARRLLCLLATFADAAIPYELLLDPASLAVSPLFADITGSRLWQALRALDGVGLIDLIPRSPWGVAVLTLHPLIRDASAPSANAAGEEYTGHVGLAAHLLKRAVRASETDSRDDPRINPVWELLTAHALLVLEAVMVEPTRFDGAAAVAAADAVEGTADYLFGRGLSGGAETTYRMVLAVKELVLGSGHRDTLSAREGIGSCLTEQGEFDEADAVLRDVLAEETRLLGPDHPDTLRTRSELAYLMAEREDHAEAEAEYRDVLAAMVRVLGPDHRDTMSARHELAATMAYRGNHVEAAAEYRDVVAAMLRVYGPDNKNTMAARSNLAREMATLGDRAGAAAEWQEVLDSQIRVLGPDHHDTMITGFEIAWARGEGPDPLDTFADMKNFLARYLEQLDSPRDER